VSRSFGGRVEATEPIVRRRRDRQFRTTEEKRLIVEATRRAGVSVAAVAQAHGVNANQVFYWRKLYDAGQLTCKTPSPVVDMEPARVCLLPVTVEGEQPQELVAECKADQRASSCSSEGSIELTLARGQVRIAGMVDAGTLRTVLRCLLA
jgi:transposase